VDNPFAVVHFFHIIYLMSFLNKLVSWPVFTLLLLILLTVPNIGLTATASLSHDGGSIWKIGGPDINFNWTTNTTGLRRVVIQTSRTTPTTFPTPGPCSMNSHGLIFDTLPHGANSTCNTYPATPATQTGSFSWEVGSRYVKSGDPLSYPFYVRVLTLKNTPPYNTVDAGSAWSGPYRILRADACSLTTQVTGSGTTTPSGTTVWSNGQTKTVTFTPNAGHRIATAVFPQPYGVRPSACIETNGGACIPVATSGTGTLTKTLSCTTGAQYKAKVTFEAIPSCPVPSQIVGTGGKVTLVPAAPVTTVAGGQTLQVKAESNAGYKIKEFKLRGYDSWFTMSDATGKATSTQTLSCPAGQTKKLGYDVAFIPNVECKLNTTYTPMTPASGVGTLTPYSPDVKKPTLIKNGEDKTVNIKSKIGYQIKSVKVNNTSVTIPSDKKQEMDVSIACDIKNNTSAELAKIPQNVAVEFETISSYAILSSSSGVGGSITPLGFTSLTRDKTQKYTIRINEGFAIGELRIDGVVYPSYTGETGTVTSGRDRGQTPKVDITLFYLGEDLNPRTISVKFVPVCTLTAPLKTLADVDAGKQTWINHNDFRGWTTINESLIRTYLEQRQTCMVPESNPQYTPIEPQSMSDRTTALGASSQVKVPLTFVYSAIEKNTGTTLASHAVVITNVVVLNNPAAVLPPVRGYTFDFIDPNLRGEVNSAECLNRSHIIGGQEKFVTSCNMKTNLSGTSGKDFIIVARDRLSSLNNYIRTIVPVRDNSQSWLKSKFTSKITNEFGLCKAWSEFNTKAALLVRECSVPIYSQAGPGIKEEISFLNQLAVKETITDKYLAQLALLWQIDDVMRGWWQKIMK
jgi:hypothetical protein